MKKPLLDLKRIRVDLFFRDEFAKVTVTHLPTDITESAEGLIADQLELRVEAIIKITENEVYRQWLVEFEEE